MIIYVHTCQLVDVTPFKNTSEFSGFPGHHWTSSLGI